MSKVSGRAIRTGGPIKASGQGTKSDYKSDILKRAAEILNHQAEKEMPITPNLKNYIRAVVYGSHQVNNLNYDVLGDVGSSLKLDDIILLIDVYHSKIIMKKETYDPVEFDLKNRLIKTHGVVFDDTYGEIVGITDVPNMSGGSSNFIVSEKALVPLFQDMATIKEKIDLIITMLEDVQQLIEDFQDDTTERFDEVDTRFNIVDNALTGLGTTTNTRFNTVDSTLTALSTATDTRFNTVDAKLADITAQLTNIESLCQRILIDVS
jgi:flagellar capping protein FliD